MKLLVSVRSLEEALIAWQGRADVVDIKEPILGSLGRASASVMSAIVQELSGKTVLSAALGELNDFSETTLPDMLIDFWKLGLSGCAGREWQQRLVALRRTSSQTLVPAAYVDFVRAESPDLSEIAQFVINERFPVLLLDTFRKDGRGLFHWATEEQLTKLAERLRSANIDLALAGSLSEADILSVRRINPCWFAVRGAACQDSQREATINVERVVRLKSLLANR